jgi:hypothetical protein
MQYRRVISAVLIPATLLLFTGCTKTVGLSPEQLQPEENVKVFWTADGQAVQPDRTTVRGDTIYAEVGDDTFRFALNEVRGVAVKRPDHLKTAILIISVAALVGVVVAAAATWEPMSSGSWSWDLPY